MNGASLRKCQNSASTFVLWLVIDNDWRRHGFCYRGSLADGPESDVAIGRDYADYRQMIYSLHEWLIRRVAGRWARKRVAVSVDPRNVCPARERALSPGCCSLNAVDDVDPRRWQGDDAVCFVVSPFGGAHDVNPESRESPSSRARGFTLPTIVHYIHWESLPDLRLPVNPHAPLRGRCRCASACIRDVGRYTASRAARERVGKGGRGEGGRRKGHKQDAWLWARVCARRKGDDEGGERKEGLLTQTRFVSLLGHARQLWQ